MFRNHMARPNFVKGAFKSDGAFNAQRRGDALKSARYNLHNVFAGNNGASPKELLKVNLAPVIIDEEAATSIIFRKTADGEFEIDDNDKRIFIVADDITLERIRNALSHYL